MAKRVLIVDDDNDILSLVRIVLSEEGYDVDTAHNGYDALALLRDHEPGLIYVDLAMPTMGGWEFVRALRSEHLAPAVPVVVMSASPLENARARQMQVVGHMPKPFDLDFLIAQTSRYLDAPAAGTTDQRP